MKFLLLKILVLFGISKAYSGTHSIFLENVTKINAAEGAASGCKESSGTERPTSKCGSPK